MGPFSPEEFSLKEYTKVPLGCTAMLIGEYSVVKGEPLTGEIAPVD